MSASSHSLDYISSAAVSQTHTHTQKYHSTKKSCTSGSHVSTCESFASCSSFALLESTACSFSNLSFSLFFCCFFSSFSMSSMLSPASENSPLLPLESDGNEEPEVGLISGRADEESSALGVAPFCDSSAPSREMELSSFAPSSQVDLSSATTVSAGLTAGVSSAGDSLAAAGSGTAAESSKRIRQSSLRNTQQMAPSTSA